MTDPVQNSDPTQQPQIENGWKRFWESGLGSSLRNQLATWFVGVLIAVLTVFSSTLTERIKFSINRADLRVKSYEQLSQDLSEYVFDAEFCQESFEHNWTTKDALDDLVKGYNLAITKLRGNEYVYRSWLSRYWGKEEVKRFSDLMETVKRLDLVIHSLNDEIEAVHNKSKLKIDGTRASDAAKTMRPELELLETQVQTLLETSGK
jgi:hypothetical protein